MTVSNHDASESLSPELVLPRRPILIFQAGRGLDKHQESIKFLDDQISFLNSSAEDFISDIELFRYLLPIHKIEKGRLSWIFVPLRDGALAIRNYATALQALRRKIGTVSPWLNKIDTKSVKLAETEFLKTFPFAHKFRHAVAHPEHFYDSQKNTSITKATKIGENVFLNSEGSNVSVKQGLVGEKFFSTFGGEFIEYNANLESSKFVAQNIAQIFSAFEKVGI